MYYTEKMFGYVREAIESRDTLRSIHIIHKCIHIVQKCEQRYDMLCMVCVICAKYGWRWTLVSKARQGKARGINQAKGRQRAKAYNYLVYSTQRISLKHVSYRRIIPYRLRCRCTINLLIDSTVYCLLWKKRETDFRAATQWR